DGDVAQLRLEGDGPGGEEEVEAQGLVVLPVAGEAEAGAAGAAEGERLLVAAQRGSERPLRPEFGGGEEVGEAEGHVLGAGRDNRIIAVGPECVLAGAAPHGRDG